jgi:aminoglycoside phosphotransferase (APT) family kinase protein
MPSSVTIRAEGPHLRKVNGVAELTRIAQGREAEIFAWDDGTVLRLFRDGDAAARLRREALAMRSVRNVLPIVPQVFGETVVDGRPGLILERVDGPDLMTVLGRRPARIWEIGKATGRLHAEINGVDAATEIETLHERIERVVRRSAFVPAELGEFALKELRSLPEGVALCHGDFHPGNILEAKSGPMVIDWANVARGDAAADFARSRMMGWLGSLPPGTPLLIRLLRRPGIKLYEAAYVRGYRSVRVVDMDLASRWEIVRAADRLAEGIDEERTALLRLLERARVARG